MDSNPGIQGVLHSQLGRAVRLRWTQVRSRGLDARTCFSLQGLMSFCFGQQRGCALQKQRAAARVAPSRRSRLTVPRVSFFSGSVRAEPQQHASARFVSARPKRWLRRFAGGAGCGGGPDVRASAGKEGEAACCSGRSSRVLQRRWWEEGRSEPVVPAYAEWGRQCARRPGVGPLRPRHPREVGLRQAGVWPEGHGLECFGARPSGGRSGISLDVHCCD
jgi:hypothetical protein